VRLLRLVVGATLTCASGPAWGGGSLDALAKEASDLGPIAGAAVVVAAPLTSDQPDGGNNLPIHLAALVATGLGAGVTAYPRSVELAAARSAVGFAKTLIFVRASIALGDVRMTAELYSRAANVWERLRSPLDAVTRHAAAHAKIDSQTRALLTPLSLERLKVQRFRLDEDDVLAAACGDVDGDGRYQLLLVSRSRVALGHLQDGGFAPRRTVAWSDLAPRAAVPLREPLGSAVAGEARILVGSTDYGGVALSGDLAKKEQLAGIPVWGGRAPSCLLAQPSAGAFDGAPIDCAPSRDPKPMLAVPAPRFDAFAAADIVGPGGDVRALVAVREPSGRLKMRWGDEASGIQGSFGAELAVGDLDQDGFPEVVTTTGTGDAIDVQTLGAGGAAPQNRIHLPTPDAVRALAVCPPGEHGAPALAAVVGHEVWRVRAELATPPKASAR
jgi:hypothetical protein